MAVRGIRGAITVENNNEMEIIEATEILLKEIIEANNINQDDMASIIFTVTPDLNAVFPAVAARKLGYTDVALMCMNEINVPGSLKMCVRVLMHVNTEKSNQEIKNIYLRGAKVLRPDVVHP